jgi:RNA polymerase-associated protein CTR9
MSAVYANGANGVNGAGKMFPPPRYSDVPNAITISVADEEGGQLDVEVPLDEDIQDDPTELDINMGAGRRGLCETEEGRRGH